MARKVSLVIQKDAAGYSAFCPEVSGCESKGESLEEVVRNMKEAIEAYLEMLTAEEQEDRLSR